VLHDPARCEERGTLMIVGDHGMRLAQFCRPSSKSRLVINLLQSGPVD
jgi:hypothetical protein